MKVLAQAAVLMLVALASAQAVQAQSCSFDFTDINFGTVTPPLGTAFDSTGTFTATCTGTRNRVVRVCPNIGSGTGNNNASASERYMLNGATQMKYNFYQDAARITVWGSFVWPYAPTAPTIDITIGTSGSGTASATVYARVFPGQPALPPGTYQSNFSGNHTLVAFQYRNTVAQSCDTINTTNGVTTPFLASAVVAPSCSISATVLDFGQASSTGVAIDGSNTISVTCTSGTPYTIALNGGLANATNPAQRRMTATGTTDYVQYGIYRDAARSLAWGSASGTTVSGTGTGSAQSFTGYGRTTAQATPVPRDYSDTVVATVTY
ncbi:spore coat U domain-containing protein [Aestuariivirga sp.]|uniref:Csu type fimbrial protein n=1 Tax=Aestuariivirga sp. TaxID=2650926 RepID=UPI0039E46A34